MLVLILSCVCTFVEFLYLIRVLVCLQAGCSPLSILTRIARAVFSVLVDYYSAIYFVQAVKKLE